MTSIEILDMNFWQPELPENIWDVAELIKWIIGILIFALSIVSGAHYKSMRDRIASKNQIIKDLTNVISKFEESEKLRSENNMYKNEITKHYQTTIDHSKEMAVLMQKFIVAFDELKKM